MTDGNRANAKDMTFQPIVSKQIGVTTLLASAVLVGVAILLLFLSYKCRERIPVRYVLLANGILPLLLLFGSTAFRIRSYEITSDQLVIHLGLGSKNFPLSGLQNAQVVERPFAGARRTMGIGGLWSMYGLFHSSQHGAFSAYAATTASGVMLTWPDKKVLIAPEHPSLFVQSVKPAK
jgi:hypothetical protein